jgi:hypothetical protein
VAKLDEIQASKHKKIDQQSIDTIYPILKKIQKELRSENEKYLKK